MTHSRDGAGTRPDVVDWGIVGENAALRHINTGDPIDVARYWETNISIPAGLMVGDIDTLDELVDNAKHNGRNEGYTFAISGITGKEKGEFQGFVQFIADRDHELRNKIQNTGLFVFFKDVVLWEVSYAKYPAAAPRQVASAVRAGLCIACAQAQGRGILPARRCFRLCQREREPGLCPGLDERVFRADQLRSGQRGGNYRVRPRHTRPGRCLAAELDCSELQTERKSSVLSRRNLIPEAHAGRHCPGVWCSPDPRCCTV